LRACVRACVRAACAQRNKAVSDAEARRGELQAANEKLARQVERLQEDAKLVSSGALRRCDADCLLHACSAAGKAAEVQAALNEVRQVRAALSSRTLRVAD
jgi:hypothetical protein